MSMRGDPSLEPGRDPCDGRLRRVAAMAGCRDVVMPGCRDVAVIGCQDIAMIGGQGTKTPVCTFRAIWRGKGGF